MPTYDYTCLGCRKDFEIFRSISDRSKPACPTCGKTRIERRIVPPNFILKGAGFHVNEYKKSAPKEEKTPENKAAAEPSKK